MINSVIARRRASLLAAGLLLVAGLSCDRVTGLPTTGSISVVLLSGTGAQLTVLPRQDPDTSVFLSVLSDDPVNVLLDGVRVTVTGPTNKSVTVTTATGQFFNATLDGLEPGSYTVVVEGLVGGKVGHFGQVSNVNVAAGANTQAQVTFPAFQPAPLGGTPTSVDTVEVLHFTVQFGAVPSATSYVVDVSQSPTMTSPTSTTVTTTTTNVTVAAEGKYYFTVRAVNATVGTTGLPSVPRGVQVFQSVATVTVTPPTPTISAGETVQFTFEARDADNVVVQNPPVVWMSNNQAVATVHPTTGLATALTNGVAVIAAVAKGTPGTATLTSNALPATTLAFIVQPSNTTAGVATSPAIQVEVRNAQGGRVTGSNAPVTLAIGTNPGGGTLSGTTTVNAINGVASFSGLSINRNGTGYTLAATSAGLTQGTSSAFDIATGPITKLAITTQPTAATTDQLLQVVVAAQDAMGNVVTSPSVNVSIAFGANPGSAQLFGTVGQPTVSGLATFSDLQVTRIGDGYTLVATSTGLTSVTSGIINMTAGAPHHVSFLNDPADAEPTGPLDEVQVGVRDFFNNQTSVDGIELAVILFENPTGATLSGTQLRFTSGGVATFDDLSVDLAGDGYTLATGGAGLDPDFDGAPFDVFLDFVDVSMNSAGAFGCGVTRLGSGYCWGQNSAGQLGNAANTESNQPQRVSGGLQFTKITTGGLFAVDGFACGLVVDQSIFCWGQNGSGQLGTGNFNPSNVPVPVAGGLSFLQVNSGNAHTCAVTVAQTAVCWGLGANGRLGNGVANSNTPINVLGGHTFSVVDAGGSHTCGIRNTDNVVLCWGFGNQGQLGAGGVIGAIPDSPTPVSAGGAYSFISAGESTTCAVNSNDRRLYCWGTNTNSQYGNGNQTSNSVATLSGGSLVFARVTAGRDNTCGITTSGEAFCWGLVPGGTNIGQLGIGNSTTGSATPAQVIGFRNWIKLQASNFTTVGLASDGAFSWGNGQNAERGDGTDLSVTTPGRILGSRTP